MKKLIIIGAGGHGKVVADIARLNGYDEIYFFDDGSTNDMVSHYKIIGKTVDFSKYLDYDFFVAIGSNNTREKVSNILINGNAKLVTLIHPRAVIGEDVEIGNGTVVMANAVINPGSKIGQGCIINTCSSVDHDNVIGDYSHVSVGAHLAGTVKLGNKCFVCAGVTIINNISICDNTIIGAGATVINDILDEGTYVGVPSRKIK